MGSSPHLNQLHGKNSLHKPDWHSSTNCLPLDCNVFRHLNHVPDSQGSSLPVPLHTDLLRSIFLRKMMGTAVIFSLLLNLFCSIHILYSDFKAISAAQLLHRGRLPRALLSPCTGISLHGV